MEEPPDRRSGGRRDRPLTCGSTLFRRHRGRPSGALCFSWCRSRGFNDAAAFISTGMLNTGAARGATKRMRQHVRCVGNRPRLVPAPPPGFNTSRRGPTSPHRPVEVQIYFPPHSAASVQRQPGNRPGPRPVIVAVRAGGRTSEQCRRLRRSAAKPRSSLMRGRRNTSVGTVLSHSEAVSLIRLRVLNHTAATTLAISRQRRGRRERAWAKEGSQQWRLAKSC